SCRSSGMIGRAPTLVRGAGPLAGGGYECLLRSCARSIAHRLPSLRPSPIPPRPPPPLVAACSGASQVLRGSSDSSPVPRQRRLLAFLAAARDRAPTAGQTRPPGFPRDPFVRDAAFDPGRATAPRDSGAAHVAFDVNHRLGPCDVEDFVAQSHTPHDRCERFPLAVAGDGASLARGRALPLTRAGLPPAGSRQLRLAHDAIFSSPCGAISGQTFSVGRRA